MLSKGLDGLGELVTIAAVPGMACRQDMSEYFQFWKNVIFRKLRKTSKMISVDHKILNFGLIPTKFHT